jgi:hypothetical protein
MTGCEDSFPSHRNGLANLLWVVFLEEVKPLAEIYYRSPALDC